MSADVISIMSVVGFVVALAVVALTVYVSTLARRREFGVLKAIGIRNGVLYRIVLVQAALSVVAAFAIGLAFTGLLGLALAGTDLNLELAITPTSVAKVAVFATFIAGLAALLPIRQVARRPGDCLPTRSPYMTALTLDVRDVTKRFGDGPAAVTAVRDVSLAVEPGEIVLIMGPSGSGKTTLLSMMGALLKPTTGSIHLDGTELSALSESRLPEIRLRQFGFVFQDFNLLSALSVLENVAIVAELAGANGKTARAKAAQILTELGLGDRLDFLPEKLSGGEKQRVAIARALVNEPTVILADEPTANLDSKIGHEIMRLLRGIAKDQGRSVVIVSHDQRIRDIADRVLWLEDGSFKDFVTLAVDPVCGMSVEREHSVSSERDGETLFFCSRGCRQEFLGELLEAGEQPGLDVEQLVGQTRDLLRLSGVIVDLFRGGPDDGAGTPPSRA
jgi:ABC-type antimicrobial peptide transport system, ATPase component